jgi:phage portal protein BeeE
VRLNPFGKRADPPLGLDAWLSWWQYGGLTQPAFTLGADKGQEDIDHSFPAYVAQAYKQNGVVFACMLVRLLLFSEARFQFRQLRNGQPGDLFGTAELAVLENPEVNQTTRDLLSRAIQDVDLAGNYYAIRRGDRIKRLRPDWVTIVVGGPDGDPEGIDAQLVGYIYHPGGRYSDKKPVNLLAGQLAHFVAVPDPLASYRGMSWLTPVIREIQADGAATLHKLKFFENGATPNLAVKIDPTVQKAAFDEWVKAFREQHEGVANAYKTLILGGGADFTVVGSDMRQTSFKDTQGAGETRIAAAAGVPPVIVGLSEGLAAATYSNYQLAMRRFSDLTMRPLWGNMASSMAPLVAVPGGSELWYDARHIPALAESERDRAEIEQFWAATIRTLVDAGFQPDAAVQAVISGDFSILEHSGLYSVQLQPAGTPQAKPTLVGVTVPAGTAAPAATNGQPPPE